MFHISHEVLALVSIALTCIAFVPYLRGIYCGTIRPHLFTWLIWTVITGLVAYIQWTEAAGPGAWATLAVTLGCFVSLLASLVRGEKSRTSFDWLCLILAAIAMPLWWFSGTPLYSVILLTLIELLGFGPTLRKTLLDPYSESVIYFALNILKYLFAALALESWTLETALYPVATGVMAFAFTVLMIICRSLKPKRISHVHPAQ